MHSGGTVRSTNTQKVRVHVKPFLWAVFMLTQTELKRHLHYDKDTGIFTRIISNASNVKVGDVAGIKMTEGYLQITVNNRKYLSHRLAWLYIHGEFPPSQIDHKNGIKDDNSIFNLREANNQQNNFNVGAQKNNTSGFKGVSFYKITGKWKATAKLSGKRYHLGYFSTPELASEAYQAFAKKHHAEFYRDEF